MFWENADLWYIGQASNYKTRVREHLNRLSNKAHHNYKVQAAYNAHGIPNFFLLEECGIPQLNQLEIIWTNEFHTVNTPWGLNIIEAGGVGYGINAPHSKYTKVQVLKVFSLLYKGKLSYAEIVRRTRVDKSTIQSIRKGTKHTWLLDAYPTQYKTMRSGKTPSKRVFHKSEPIEKICEVCKIKFTILDSKFNQKYCGRNCYHKSRIIV